jgi:death-on-curing family protein
MNKITLAHIEHLSFSLACETMGWNEPIPNFDSRYPNILESCLAAPFQRFDKRDLYRGFIGKAAMLFYLMIKNHPFQNGNKRLAMTTLLVFLFINKKWLVVDAKKLYSFAVWVAESPAELKKETVLAAEKFISKYLVDRDEIIHLL